MIGCTVWNGPMIKEPFFTLRSLLLRRMLRVSVFFHYGKCDCRLFPWQRSEYVRCSKFEGVQTQVIIWDVHTVIIFVYSTRMVYSFVPSYRRHLTCLASSNIFAIYCTWLFLQSIQALVGDALHGGCASVAIRALTFGGSRRLSTSSSGIRCSQNGSKILLVPPVAVSWGSTGLSNVWQ